MFRPKVDLLPVLADVGEGIATDHGRVVPLVVLGGQGRLNVVGSPGDVSPRRILTTVLMLVELGNIGADGVVELLHERTSRVRVGNLVRLLPRMMNN